MFNVKRYQEQTQPIKFTLIAGETIETRFFINKLDNNSLESLQTSEIAAARTGSLLKMHEAYRDHLALVVTEFPYEDEVEGKTVRKTARTTEEKAEFLKYISYDDCKGLIAQINEAITSPLVESPVTLNEEKPSSDGQAQKEK